MSGLNRSSFCLMVKVHWRRGIDTHLDTRKLYIDEHSYRTSSSIFPMQEPVYASTNAYGENSCMWFVYLFGILLRLPFTLPRGLSIK